MTVINMLEVKGGGVAVADEQSSTEIRKMNTSDKLHKIDLGGRRIAIYGGSGPSFLLNQLYLDSQEAVNQRRGDDTYMGVRDAAEVTKEMVIRARNRKKDSTLRAAVGMGLDDMISGTYNGKPIGEAAMQIARNVLQGVDKDTHLAILFGGLGDKGFEIYGIDSSGESIRTAIPYYSIGSGSDESQKVLNQYVARMSREARREIDPTEGLVKAIEATNAAADTNVGVGGSPSIMYVTRRGLKVPSENHCVAASEVVRGFTGGFLDKSFVYDAVSRLVTRDDDFGKVLEEMMGKAKNPKALDRFLRGYKEK